MTQANVAGLLNRLRATASGPWAAAYVVVGVALMFGTLQLLPPRYTFLTALFGLNVILAQSINLLTGFAGQISLGHAAFHGIGAYATGYFTTEVGLPVHISIPLAVLVATLVGGIIAFPALRVREFYLAMVTVGFLLISVVVFQQWSSVTGGFSGMRRIPSSSLRTLELIPGQGLSTAQYLIVIVIVVIVVMLLLRRLVQSNTGRSLMAIQQSDALAASVGINVGLTTHKTWMLSAAMAGLAGAMYAHLIGFIAPENFGVIATVVILIMAVLGGMGTILGPFLGAAVFTYLPDRLQAFVDYQLLVYGLILMFSFVLLPRGLTGLMKLRTAVIRPGFLDAASASTGGAAAWGVGQDAGSQPGRTESVEHGTAIDEHSDLRGTRDSVAPNDAMLEIDDVSLSFGGIRALRQVNFRVGRGEIYGLIGPNGSGKTSLVNVITGLYHADSGSVRHEGDSILGRRPDQIASRGIARTFQRPQVLEDLTVAENVALGAAGPMSHRYMRPAWFSRRATDAEQACLERVVRACQAVGLDDTMGLLAGSLPFGIRRLIEVARCMVSECELMILDEPAAGLTEAEIHHLVTLLGRLRAGGMTILVIDHNMSFLLGLVDRVTVLDEGVDIFDGRPTDARSDARVIEAYLGAVTDA